MGQKINTKIDYYTDGTKKHSTLAGYIKIINGKVYTKHISKINKNFTSQETEFYAIFLAIQDSISNKYNNIIIHTDVEIIVNEIKERSNQLLKAIKGLIDLYNIKIHIIHSIHESTLISMADSKNKDFINAKKIHTYLDQYTHKKKNIYKYKYSKFNKNK